MNNTKSKEKIEYKTVSCSSCNQRWCARYNQRGTYSQCRDHPINREILNESKK